MKANLAGRVRNTSLPKTHPLLPLFEAVVNSIDAIEEAALPLEQGAIVIAVRRQPALELPSPTDPEDRIHPPIRSFEIHDNGIGFTEPNYQAFDEADTQVKASKGGRGVGRFIWLKAFESVSVDSIFQSNGDLRRRTFNFSLESPDGISDHKVVPTSEHTALKTVVSLLGFKEEYERLVPRSSHTIARRLIEHFLEYYVLTRMPRVTILDDAEQDVIALDQLYDDLVAASGHNTIEIASHKFDIAHFFLRSGRGLSHRITYCANSRAVLDERIANKVPNLPSVLHGADDDEELVYAGYVSSAYLDDHVNQERTAFQTAPEGSRMFPGEIAWSELEKAVLDDVKGALGPYTAEVRQQKEKRIREYVANQAPEYRHIMKHHSDRLDAIPPDAPDDKLPVHLFEIQHEIEVQLKKDVSEILTPIATGEGGLVLEEDLERLTSYWDELNEVGKANLAKYIVHRKYVLTFLENALKRTQTGKYLREEVIHRVVFPLKATSDDIGYDQHNLWIIDEKLAYHRYLASDLAIAKAPQLATESDSRPDLLFFFDRAIAATDDDPPYSTGIVIFEFKKPMRDDYADEENPIQQVLRYVEEIKSGQRLDKDGRPFNAGPGTPFYCYVVADITDSLREQAKFANLRRTPDGLGFFGYNEEIGAYLEIISFDKMVFDSKKRNRVLFEKLHLPDKLI